MTDHNENVEVAENTMLGDLMRCVLEQVKALPRPWDAMSEEEQDVIEKINEFKQALQPKQGGDALQADNERLRDALCVASAYGGDPSIPEIQRAKFRQIANILCPEGEALNGTGEDDE